MKNQIKFLKSSVLELTFASAMLFLISTTLPSCNSNTNTVDSKEVAEEHNEAKFDNDTEKDAEFLVSAAEINLKEIQLGQLAQKKSMHTQVKSLGMLMEKEHSKALEDLKILASKKQISIPLTLSDDGRSANTKLMDMKASNFDQEYCDMVVSGHKDAISKFEKASTDAADADIRNWASAMLPTLRTHLDLSISCQKECEKIK
jgi:putative membrane protein